MEASNEVAVALIVDANMDRKANNQQSMNIDRVKWDDVPLHLVPAEIVAKRAGIQSGANKRKAVGVVFARRSQIRSAAIRGTWHMDERSPLRIVCLCGAIIEGRPMSIDGYTRCQCGHRILCTAEISNFSFRLIPNVSDDARG